jgi:hypothetical protein
MTLPANDLRRVSSPDGAIVLNVRRGTMFRVNPVGSTILDLLEQGVPPAKIAEQISREFEVPLEAVQNDLQPFLQSLRTYGVIESPEGNR